MKDFAAIDFETANSECNSVCSVGIGIVRDGEIVDTMNHVISPPYRGLQSSILSTGVIQGKYSCHPS